MRTALSIAGSDSSGGAGIQADIKTMTMNGVYAMTAVTALTAQNTTGVAAILEVPPEFLEQQLDAVFQDIRPDAVKIGMLPSPVLVETAVQRLKTYQAVNIVVDPVLCATSGPALAAASAFSLMKRSLFPLAAVITPNIPEAEVLSGLEIRSQADMERAAKRISDDCGCAVLCKGGHSINGANDLLCSGGEYTWFRGGRIDNPNTHGTGCTLSSAIASNLAKGYDLKTSVARSKAYVSGALKGMLDLGHGSGPVHHLFDAKSEYMD